MLLDCRAGHEALIKIDESIGLAALFVGICVPRLFFIQIETKEDRAIKRTVSIPKWMDDRVVESGLSLSRVLQDALSQRFQ